MAIVMPIFCAYVANVSGLHAFAYATVNSETNAAVEHCMSTIHSSPSFDWSFCLSACC